MNRAERLHLNSLPGDTFQGTSVRRVEMGDYITALDAAAQIGMSPARFASLLREKRDALPVEINREALAGNPGAIFAPLALDNFYAGKHNRSISLEYLKIHRIDWRAYVASLATAAPVDQPAEPASTSPAGQESIVVPRELWEGKTHAAARDAMRPREGYEEGFPDFVIAYALFHWCGLTNKTRLGKLLGKPARDGQPKHDSSCRRLANSLLTEAASYTIVHN